MCSSRSAGLVGGEEEDGNEDDGVLNKRVGAQQWEDSDQEEYYFSKSKSVAQQLWKGSVSAGMLIPRLQRAMKEYMSDNKHGVAYRGRRRPKQSSRQVLCEMKRRGRVRTLDGHELPFSTLGWRKIVPPSALEELYSSSLRSCAVVTSAGAILRSGLGKEIGE